MINSKENSSDILIISERDSTFRQIKKNLSKINRTFIICKEPYWYLKPFKEPELKFYVASTDLTGGSMGKKTKVAPDYDNKIDKGNTIYLRKRKDI